MSGTFILDMVKINRDLIMELIEELVYTDSDGNIDVSELQERLYGEFQREATLRESVTLRDYVQEHLERKNATHRQFGKPF